MTEEAKSESPLRHKVSLRVAVDGWVIGNETHNFAAIGDAHAFADMFLKVVQAVSVLAGSMAGATLTRSIKPSEKVDP